MPSIPHFWEYCPARENPGFPTREFPGGQYFANPDFNFIKNYLDQNLLPTYQQQHLPRRTF